MVTYVKGWLRSRFTTGVRFPAGVGIYSISYHDQIGSEGHHDSRTVSAAFFTTGSGGLTNGQVVHVFVA